VASSSNQTSEAQAVQGLFGGVCEVSLLLLLPGAPGDEGCVEGVVVVSCDGDWFVVCGVLDGVLVLGGGTEPAGRVTTVPLRGGRYNGPFCPHAAVSASGTTAVKCNTRRFMDSPADGRAAPTIHE
jgi:hypothetical protein